MHLISTIFVIFLAASAQAMTLSELKCGVCKAIVEEIDHAIAKENPKKMIDVGSYRLDPEGNQKQKSIPYVRSEIHIHEILEKICDSMGDYVQATYKSNGAPLVMRLITFDGKMNPEMSNVDLVQDSNLNKGLEFYCQAIVDDHEDDIVRLFSGNADNIDIRLCSDAMKVCDQTLPEDDYDLGDREEL